VSLSRTLRERLGLSSSSWAKALSVSEATVKRWEDGSNEPSGLAEEVMRGISLALDEGADPERTGKLVALGIGALLQYELLKRCGAPS
jgi:ribosome-binding protein aMBF1 (putative translation factor)